MEDRPIPAYINNAQDYNAGLHILANKWIIIKNIIQKQRRQEEINVGQHKKSMTLNHLSQEGT